MKTTKIEWTEQTWNPVTGCTKVSQGCKNCYAERLAPKVFAGQVVEVDTTPPKHPDMKASAFRPRHFTDVLTHPDRLDAPLHWRKPRRIFVNSMSDLFHEDVPDEFIKTVFTVMAIAKQHTFQVLTKRSKRMRDLVSSWSADDMYDFWYSFDGGAREIEAWPLPNVWLGVSVEDQPTADERIPLLLQTPAAVRFISAEPLLGAIDIARYLPDDGGYKAPGDTYLNWVISGGESGPKARPSHPDWFRSLRDQCTAGGVPFFFKQWGGWWPISQMPNGYFDDEENWVTGWSQCVLQLDGRIEFAFPVGAMTCIKVGKKKAGRILDGRTWDEYPEAAS